MPPPPLRPGFWVFVVLVVFAGCEAAVCEDKDEVQRVAAAVDDELSRAEQALAELAKTTSFLTDASSSSAAEEELRFQRAAAVLQGPASAMLLVSELLDSVWLARCSGNALIRAWQAPKSSSALGGSCDDSFAKEGALVVGNVSCPGAGANVALFARVARPALQQLLERAAPGASSALMAGNAEGHGLAFVAASKRWQLAQAASLHGALPLRGISGARVGARNLTVFLTLPPPAKIAGVCTHGMLFISLSAAIAIAWIGTRFAQRHRRGHPNARSQQQQQQQQHSNRQPKSIPSLRRLGSWNFDVRCALCDKCGVLTRVGFHALDTLGLVDHFGFDRCKLSEFLCDVEAGYRPNAYHNAEHAADVTQAMYALLCATQDSPFSKVEQLAAIFASICHDYKHPGVNNVFLVRTRDPLSLRYNRLSVLESMHASESLSLLLSPKHAELLASLPADVFDSFYSTVVQLILATDMERHIDITSSFALLLKGDFSLKHSAHRLSLLRIYIKFADISNPTRPWNVCQMWVGRIMAEFWQQGDREKEHGLSVSPYMDRDAPAVPQSQATFGELVVRPMAETVGKFVSPSLAETLLSNVLYNVQHWKDLAASHATPPKP